MELLEKAAIVAYGPWSALQHHHEDFWREGGKKGRREGGKGIEVREGGKERGRERRRERRREGEEERGRGGEGLTEYSVNRGSQ